jgi:hypothetical protein
MDDKTVEQKVADAPFAIRQCATGGQTYYYQGACLAKGSYDCPFQAKQERVVFDNVKFVACMRFHPYFQNGQQQV